MGDNMKNTVLSDLVRPHKLQDVFGQEHITAKGMIIDMAISRNNIPNMIFYGVPGVGKTTVAKIIAENTTMPIHMFNATHCKTDDVRKVILSYTDGIFKQNP